MNLLERTEHRLSTWIEGAFAGASPDRLNRWRLGEPCSRSRRSKRISMACVYAPNRFSICLSEPDLADLSSLTQTLEAELKGVLQQKAEKDQLRFIGPISLVFLADPRFHGASSRLRLSSRKGRALMRRQARRHCR